jgi:hypothetical protein
MRTPCTFVAAGLQAKMAPPAWTTAATLLADAAKHQGTSDAEQIRLAFMLQKVEVMVGQVGQQQEDMPLSHAAWKAIIIKDKVSCGQLQRCLFVAGSCNIGSVPIT